MIYTVVIYDENGDRATVLRDVQAPNYSRAKNSADQISFSLPRNSAGVEFIETGRRFEILRTIGGQTDVEESGFISNHGYSGDLYGVEGYTEEIVLTRYLTPPQYGYVLYSENQNLSTLAQQLKSAFVIDRVKRNWSDYIVANSNVNTSFDDFLILNNSGTSESPNYVSSGSVTFQFQKSASEKWDRFRWVSDYYSDEQGEVSTKVSYRTSNNTSSWGAFSTPQAGALTDVVGIVIAGLNDTYLQVKVDFATDTTEASPLFFVLEAIKRAPTLIHTVNVQTGGTDIPTLGLDADNTNFLEVLIAACESSGWEFYVFDGTLFVASSFGVNRSNSYSVVAS